MGKSSPTGLRLFISSLALFFSLARSSAAQPALTGLDEAEAVLQKSSGLDDFLAHPDWVDEYYVSLAKYFGPDKFQRKAFNAVLEQLRAIKENIPGLKERLWSKEGLGPEFRIQAALQSYGRNVDARRWDEHVLQWKERLSGNSTGIAKDPQSSAKAIQATLDDLETQLAAFEKALTASERLDDRLRPFFPGGSFEDFRRQIPGTLGRKQRELLIHQFYDRLRRDPGTVAAASRVLHDHLEEEYVADLLRSNDADLVLHELVKLRNKTKETFSARIGQTRAGGVLLAAIRAEVPATSDLLRLPPPGSRDRPLFPQRLMRTNQGKMVPEGTGMAAIDFKPPPRRLHGIWKGIPLNECVGGNCASLQALTPERWLTIPLQDTRFQNVERNGQYLGFVQMVPLERQGQRAFSVDFGAPILRNRTLIPIGPDGELVSGTFLDLWMQQARTALPEDHLGFLVSSSVAINNAGVKNTVFSEPEYAWSTRRWPAVEWKHVDPQAAAMVKASQALVNGNTYGYGGNMITDGTVAGAGELALLRPFPPGIFAKLVKNPVKLEAFLRTGASSRVQPVLDYLGENHRDLQRVDEILVSIARNPTHPLALDAFRTLSTRGSQIPAIQTQISEIVDFWSEHADSGSFFHLLEKLKGEEDRARGTRRVADRLRTIDDFKAFEASYNKLGHYRSGIEELISSQRSNAEFLERVLLLSKQAGFPDPGKTQYSALTALNRTLPSERLLSEDYLTQLLDFHDPTTVSSASMLENELGNRFQDIPRNKLAGYRRLQSRIIAIPGFLNKPGSSGQLNHTLWGILLQAGTLSPGDFRALKDAYGPEMSRSGMELLEQQLRIEKGDRRLYSKIVSEALQGFARSVDVSTRSNEAATQYSRILEHADFDYARVTDTALRRFARAENDANWSFGQEYNQIQARLIAAKSEAPGAGAGSKSPPRTQQQILHETKVSLEMEKLKAGATGYGSDAYSALAELAKVLQPEDYPRDAKIAVELMTGRQSPYLLKEFLSGFLARAEIAKFLTSPARTDAQRILQAVRSFARAQPESWPKAGAAFDPAFTQELLKTHFDRLIARGNDALSGYSSEVGANPSFVERLRQRYQTHPETPLAYDLERIIPDYRLSHAQVLACLDENGRLNYGYRGLFSGKLENSRLLLKIALKKQNRSLLMEVAELMPEHPELTTTDEGFRLMLQTDHFSQEARLVSKLPPERRQALASILVRTSPAKLAEFESFLPLSEANRVLLRESSRNLNTKGMTSRAIRTLVESGARPIFSETLYTPEFISGAYAWEPDGLFAFLMESDPAYRSKILASLPGMALPQTARIEAFLSSPIEEARFLVDEEMLEALRSRHLSTDRHRARFAGKIVDDAPLGEFVAMTFHEAGWEVPREFAETLPVFLKDSVHGDLLRIDTMEKAMESIRHPGTAFELGHANLGKVLPLLPLDATLPKPARYFAALASLQEGSGLSRIKPLLLKMVTDPELLKARDFNALFLTRHRSLVPGEEKVALALELLEVAQAHGVDTSHAFSGIFGTFGFFGGGQIRRESGEAYLKAAIARAQAGHDAPGTPGNLVIGHLLHETRQSESLMSEVGRHLHAALEKTVASSGCAGAFARIQQHGEIASP